MGFQTHPARLPGGAERDASDHERLRHARDRHNGFPVGRYGQPAPMLFTRDCHNVFLGDMYRGSPAFLICGGPSLKAQDLSLLNQRGILTLAVNNAATVHRPQLWTSVDDPGNFSDAIWCDPGILKFVPLCHMEKRFTVRDERGELVPSPQLVGDMPGVLGYRRNERFIAEQFLYEDTFNWGNHSNLTDALGNKGSRSVMLVALRLLFYLGVRKIFLLGCDFRMEVGKDNYAFPQDRTPASVRGNNDTYRILNDRFRQLLPYLSQEGCEVCNCTPDSGLTAFPYLPYEEAISAVCKSMPTQLDTQGMYDRVRRQREHQPLSRQPTAALLDSNTKPANGASKEPRRTTVSTNGIMIGDDLPIDTPPLTLVVPLSRNELPTWQLTIATWLRFKPCLAKLPLLILSQGESVLNECNWSSSFLRAGEVIALPPEESRSDSWAWQTHLQQIADNVTTPWFLYLSPHAVACDSQPPIRAEWFRPDAVGRLPTLIAPPWGYSKPADIFSRLDAWADQVLSLQADAPLSVPFDPAADRVRQPTIATWSFFGRTDWVKVAVDLINPALPECSLGTYLGFLAERRRDYFVRIPLKKQGWEYSFGRSAHMVARCRELLAATDATNHKPNQLV